MTIDELVTPLTPAQVETSLYSAMVGRGLTPTAWQPGAVVRTIVSALAIVLAALTTLIAYIARSGFLEFASGPWLDLVALHVYGTTRLEETFATGSVTITNTSGVGSFVGVPVGDLVVKNAAGKTYRSTATFTLAASPGVSATVAVQADEAGSASTTVAGTLTELVTTFVGCTVTNPAALVGSDREGDEPLRARARAKTGVLSPNGPRDAYSYLATSAVRADGTSIGITRVRSIPDGVGGIDIYVADPDGTTTGPDLVYVDEAIQLSAVPLAITARLHAATPLIIPVSYTLWMRDTSGLTTGEIEALIEASLQSYLSGVSIGGDVLPSISGGHVYRSAIQAAITAPIDAYLLRVDVTLPVTANVAVATSEAPVKGAVAGTIFQVAVGSMI